jgi:AraC-like DNA-binding protein
MTDLRADLAQSIVGFSPQDGFNETPLPGIQCIKYSQTDSLTNRRWRASLCIVAQGSKEIVLGREVYRNDHEAHTIMTPIDLPVTSRVVSATSQTPFLCLRIESDPLVLSEVAAQIEHDSPQELDNPLRGIFVSKAEDPLLEASLRLVKLFNAPQDTMVLGPLVIREILYHLLKGPDGSAIGQFVRSGSKMHKMTQVIYGLKSRFQTDVDVEALAKEANMSRSAFFKDFKEVTAMSPIQYQKRLRLLEARRLMTEEGETAEGTAFKVGYRSPSQFSREYSRMFGNPPIRDSARMGNGLEGARMRWGDF